ncbi:MAG TPA: protein tyrosine phosphatase family protein [Drouetiella sp.]
MPIPNFKQINGWLYRGGQPDALGFAELRRLGIKTIICLRRSTEVRSLQRKEAEAMGFDYISIPLSYFGYPTDDQVERFFSIVNDPSRQPVFVHCKHGSDRTGMMIAFYRMTNDGWSVDQAYDEMKSAGFHKLFVYHYKLAVYRYARRRTQQDQSTSQ